MNSGIFLPPKKRINIRATIKSSAVPNLPSIIYYHLPPH
jgi:hypothetical protein